MTDYERGFNDGFAAALERSMQARGGAHVAPDFEGGKKISIGFRPDQFEVIAGLSAALACSFGAAVRNLIDQGIKELAHVETR